MARQARGEVIDPSEVQVVHCMQRCVRRAFLCGSDRYSGQSFDHRREWIRVRLEFLASVFGIDCLTYTVMSNHLHLVLRSRPDLVSKWTDAEIAQRWLRLCPKRRNQDGTAKAPNRREVEAIVKNTEALNELRRRLSDLSWWMRFLSEHIARRSNAEDKVTGHFWEGRFRAQVLLDESAVLACSAYVDLNPIRAAIAKSPETSQFTGAKDRIDDLALRSDRSRISDHDWERSRRRNRSGWMSPIQVEQRSKAHNRKSKSTGRRASNKGFLTISLCDYLQLIDWTGRQLQDGKRGAIPKNLSPILNRIGLNSEAWCDVVLRFHRHFKRAAGTMRHIKEEAKRRGQQWMHSTAALG